MRLTQILSPDLPQQDLIATHPNWTRADFNRAVFHLSGRLKQAGVQTAALWFDDAALFTCAVLAVWHSGGKVLLLPNLAQDNVEWGKTAEAFLTDSTDKKLSSDGLNIWHLPDVLTQTDLKELNTYPENHLISDHAEAWLKNVGLQRRSADYCKKPPRKCRQKL